MICVECNPDKALIEMLLPGSSPRHSSRAYDNSRVVLEVERRGYGIGLIDEDPQSSFIRNLVLPKGYRLTRNFIAEGIKVLKKGKRRFLIVICPRLEEWVIKSAEECGIDVQKEYGLSKRADRMHSELKSKKLSEFRGLLEELMDRNSQRLGKLKGR